jgi:hypothetical protein
MACTEPPASANEESTPAWWESAAQLAEFRERRRLRAPTLPVARSAWPAVVEMAAVDRTAEQQREPRVTLLRGR